MKTNKIFMAIKSVNALSLSLSEIQCKLCMAQLKWNFQHKIELKWYFEVFSWQLHMAEMVLALNRERIYFRINEKFIGKFKKKGAHIFL